MTPSCFHLATRVKIKFIHEDRKRKKEKKKNYIRKKFSSNVVKSKSLIDNELE